MAAWVLSNKRRYGGLIWIYLSPVGLTGLVGGGTWWWWLVVLTRLFFPSQMINQRWLSIGCDRSDEICALITIALKRSNQCSSAGQKLVWLVYLNIDHKGDTVEVMLLAGRLCICICIQIYMSHTIMQYTYLYTIYNVCVYDFVPMVSQDVYLGGKIRKFIFL